MPQKAQLILILLLAKLMILLSPIMNLFMYTTIIIVIWLGHGDVLNGEMNIGDLSAFIAYVNQILHSLMMVSFLFTMSSRAIASGMLSVAIEVIVNV